MMISGRKKNEKFEVVRQILPIAGGLIISGSTLQGGFKLCQIYNADNGTAYITTNNDSPISMMFSKLKPETTGINIPSFGNDSVNIPQFEITNEMMNNLEKLDKIAELKENWNGYGAPPFSQDLIRKAKDIIFFADTQPEVFPTAADTIQIEYHKENGDYLEIQISESNEFEVYVFGEEEKEYLIPGTINDIKKVVQDFYG